MADRAAQDRRRYRKIFTRLWRHPAFVALPDGEKVMTMYVLCGPQTNRIGLFLFSPGTAHEDLRITIPVVMRRLAAVCKAFGWEHDAKARVIWIPSWWTFNSPKDNIKAFQGALTDLNDVPPTPLTHKFCRNLVGIPDALHALMAPLYEAIPDGTGIERLSNSDQIPVRSQEQEQEKEQEQEQDSVAAARSLIGCWNDAITTLPKCEVESPDRIRAAKARIRERSDMAWWASAVRRIEASDFLTGRKPGKDHPNWRADIDWFLKPGTAGKVMEGKYDNRIQAPAQGLSWAEKRKAASV